MTVFSNVLSRSEGRFDHVLPAGLYVTVDCVAMSATANHLGIVFYTIASKAPLNQAEKGRRVVGGEDVSEGIIGQRREQGGGREGGREGEAGTEHIR